MKIANPAELDDPRKYVVEPEAEVFPEHEVRDKEGRVVKWIVKADLERFAEYTNRRDKEGSPCAMTIGHTVDDQRDANGVIVRRATEMEQPPVVGYWRKLRVRYSAARGCWVLCAVPYVMREHLEAAKTFPRASAEAWRTKVILDPIAILRRTPELSTQWTYQAQRYRADEADERYRYSMEPAMAEETPPNPGTDPTGPPSAKAPSPEELERFAACMAHHYPKMHEMHAKYAAGQLGGPATPPPTPPAAPPAMPPAPEPKDKMSAREQALAAENAALNRKLLEAARRKDMEQYAAKGHDVDVDGELPDVLDLPPEKYARYLQSLAKRQVDPAAAKPWLRTEDPNKDVDKYSAADVDKSEAYQRQHHARLQQFDPVERAERAMRFVKTGKETA